MPVFPRNPLLPPRSLKEFLPTFDFHVCDHANDASVVITSLVSATSYSVIHERRNFVDPETSDLVIEVKLTLTFADPDPHKAAKGCLGGDPMPNIWGASAPRPPAAPIKGLAAGGRGAGAQRTPAAGVGGGVAVTPPPINTSTPTPPRICDAPDPCGL